ncbi:MAG: thioredoxin domain-containing protein [Patescibacteria group bacterium]|nr:thioredoxin domain-containing protein [Patescibacteria group bacterium]
MKNTSHHNHNHNHDHYDHQNKSHNNQDNWLLPASILIAALLIAGAVIYSTGAKNLKNTNTNNNQEKKIPTAEPAINQNDVVLGDPNAPVTVIAFGDYQCPFCGKFVKETEPKIIKKYIQTGKVKMVYKQLAFLGNESTNAALAASCAKDQGKFWQYHDEIFDIEVAETEKVIAGKMQSSENNGNLNRDLFKLISDKLKMNTDEFLKCYDSKKYQAEIEQNMNEANTALGGKISTPTTFVNGQMVQGAQPYNVFSQIIDAAFIKK